MKEKAIEKIPYIGLQKISRIKSVKYIGVTAVKNIGHQRHLLLEVYENKKKSKKIPVVRIALTKKDFGTYWPDKQIWTRQQLSAYSPIWTNTHIHRENPGRREYPAEPGRPCKNKELLRHRDIQRYSLVGAHS